MKFIFSSLASSLLLVLVAMTGKNSIVEAGHVIALSLSGDQEVPAVDSPVTGKATFIYSAETDSILYTLDIMNEEGLGIWGAAGTYLI